MQTYAVRRLVALVGVALALQGCWLVAGQGAAPNHPIEVVGVVASDRIGASAGITQVVATFDDGRTFTYDDRSRNLAGVGPNIGDLLIAGSKPEPWIIGVEFRYPVTGQPGCYALTANGYERETTVDLDVGVSLPKAPTFKEQPLPGVGGRIWGGAICLDQDGRATEIFPGAT